MWQVEINGKKHPTWKSDDIYDLADKVELWKMNFKPCGITKQHLNEKKKKWLKKYGHENANPIEQVAFELEAIFNDKIKPIKYTKAEDEAEFRFALFNAVTTIRYWNTTQHRFADSFDF